MRKQKITKPNNLLISVMVLMGLVMIFSYSMGNVSAATPGDTIYVNASGNDNWDGLNSSYNGTSGPKATIKNAVATVNINGTVNIANGTYNENNIIINKNMNIIGESQQNTIIDGSQSATSIFTINSGLNVTISNLTIINNNNNNPEMDGAIYNDGNLTIENSTFTNNFAAHGGGAICNQGILTVNNSTFTGNAGAYGGAIFNSGSSTESNNTFTNNIANYGGAIYNEHISIALDTNNTFTNNIALNGGAIFNYGTITENNNTFTKNLAINNGGAIYNFGLATEINNIFTDNNAKLGGAIVNGGGTLTVNTSNFTGNTASDGHSGAIYNVGTAIVNFNRIVGNNPSTLDIYSTSSLVNAEDNWWGSNFEGTNPLDSGRVNFNVNTWIVLTMSSSSSIIPVGYSDFIFAYLSYDNKGNPILGIPYTGSANFKTNYGSINNANFFNDGASSVLYADVYAGVATITSSVDNAVVSLNVNTFVPPFANFTFNPTSGTVPLNVQFTDKSTGNITTYNWHFGDGTELITTESVNPIHLYSKPGQYMVILTTTGPGDSIDVKDDMITVDSLPTNTNMNAVHGYPGQNVDLIAYVTNNGNNVTNGQVQFTIGSETFTVPVNNGQATYNLNIPNWNVGHYTITAKYDGINTNYSNSVNTNTLTIDPTPTMVTVSNKTVIDNQTVSLDTTLTEINGKPISGQTVIFNVNGHKYNAITGNNGIATVQYIPFGAGNFDVTVNYPGNNNYTESQCSGVLTVTPSAYLYLKISTTNNNPKVGEKFIITYKLGNKGPDNANNVTMTIPLPQDFETSNINGDGNWTYNSKTRTITWTFTNVQVGDPYLYISGKLTKAGAYVFGSSISSNTYNINNAGVTPITITSTEPINPINPTTKTILTADTTTVPMQHTGVPIAGLLFGILSVVGGSIMSRKK